MLTAESVTVRYGGFTAVDGVSFSVGEGQWLMLAGPNGAGKSTLLNAVAQSVPYQGTIRLDGADVRGMKPAERARRIGLLTQRHHVAYAYTVEEIVNLGRYAHARGFLARQDDEGETRVEEALRLTGMTALRRASVLTLSGGELQRTFLAQALAQDPRLLLLDEPANHLDPAYQKQLFALVDVWRRQPGRAVISVVHDLSLARKYGTHALLLRGGRAVAQGEASEALRADNLRAAYGMDVEGWMRELSDVWKV